LTRFGVLLLVIGMLAVGACGGGTTSTSTGSSTTVAGAGEVKNPSEIVLVTKTEPTTWDPAGLCSWCGAPYGAYELLVDYGPNSTELSPVLATDVPSVANGLISADGLTYTFPLRQGVKFHDGTDMTADDVKYSWDRAMTMNLPDGFASILSDAIAETKVVDDFTFQVTLKAPAAYFLSSVVARFPAYIVSKDAVEANGGVVAGQLNEWLLTHEAGTGPYVLDTWDRNQQIYMTVFEDYWGEKAHLPARWVVVEDDAAATLGLRGGDYDFVEPLPNLVAELQSDPDVCITHEGYLIEPILAAFNLKIDPTKLPSEDTIPADFFWDPRVRQAFNYTFDYASFISTAMDGMGQPANYIPPSIFGYDANAPSYGQDLAKAEQLFRDSGWWDKGFTLSVLVESADLQFYRVGLILKDSLAKLNPAFVLNVIGVSGAIFDEAFTQDPYPYAMWIKNQDPYRDPHFIFSEMFSPDGPWGQHLGYRNGAQDPDTFVSLIEQAKVETDPQARYALYGQLQRMEFEDPMWLYVAQEENIEMTRCWLKGFSKNSLWPNARPQYYSK
jgi:peptide/nickel transport system substrate-binding protein